MVSNICRILESVHHQICNRHRLDNLLHPNSNGTSRAHCYSGTFVPIKEFQEDCFIQLKFHCLLRFRAHPMQTQLSRALKFLDKQSDSREIPLTVCHSKNLVKPPLTVICIPYPAIIDHCMAADVRRLAPFLEGRMNFLVGG